MKIIPGIASAILEKGETVHLQPGIGSQVRRSLGALRERAGKRLNPVLDINQRPSSFMLEAALNPWPCSACGNYWLSAKIWQTAETA